MKNGMKKELLIYNKNNFKIMRKKTFLLLGVIILAVFVFVFLSLGRTKLPFFGSKHTPSETESLLKVNEDAIAKALHAQSSEVPPLGDKDLLFGDSKAQVKVIVYEDLSFVYGLSFDEKIQKIKEEFGDKVVIAYRPFVLSNSLGLQIAEALECAKEKGKGLEMRSKIIDKSQKDSLNQDVFIALAQELGLKTTDYKQCLENNKYSATILNQSSEANNYSVFGAPTTFINKELVTGDRSLEDTTDSNGQKIEGLKTIINRQLAK